MSATSPRGDEVTASAYVPRARNDGEASRVETVTCRHPVTDAEPLLDAAGAAELLAVPVSWVRRETRAGRLPFYPLGRYRRYDRRDLIAWREQQRQGPGER